MGNRFKCYICDIETDKQSNQSIFNIKSEHSKKPIANILKRLQNGNEPIFGRDGTDTCVLCDDCIDKINAFDAASMLVKQIKREMKSIISRTEKRYRHQRSSKKVDETDRLVTKASLVASQPNELDELQFDFSFDSINGNDADYLDKTEPEVVTASEEEDFDSDDSFVWPKNRGSKQKRETNAEIEQKKRRLFKCIECPADYRDINDMQLHLVSHKNPQFRCGLCHMRLTKGRESDEHEDLHLNRPALQCIFCDEHFDSKYLLVQHVETHNGGVNAMCYICGLQISAKSMDSRHIKVHLGILDHECSYCSRKFVDTKQLNRHLKTHTGERPHACPEPGCGKKFKVTSNLKAHSYTHNRDNQPPEKLHVCTICDKTYRRQKQLDAHYYKDHDLMQIAATTPSGCSSLL